MTTTTDTSIVPLLSSGTAGPLGVLHLPRLWLKQTLGNAGVLPDGYDHCGMGYDQMTIDALNLNREAVIEFIRTKKPTYMEFEQWVVTQNGGSLDKEAVRKHNDAIRQYNHGDDLAASMRSASGIKDSNVKDAVTLNTVEDLDEVHRRVVRG